MYNDGYHHIVSTDISPACIKQMAELHKDIPSLVWSVADVTDMKDYANGDFDTVIDKGTLDAISCSDHAREVIFKMVSEMSRILKSTGSFLCVSFGRPQWRLPYIQHSSIPFKIDVEPIRPGETSPHYFYTCIKEGEVDKEAWLKMLPDWIAADNKDLEKEKKK